MDPSRATLQGDEVRACWQSPVRDEAFEGLFRELTVIPDRALVEASATATLARDGTGGTRTWAMPVYGSTATPSSAGSQTGQVKPADPRAGSSGQGLVDAPHVPARGIRSMAEHLGADER